MSFLTTIARLIITSARRWARKHLERKESLAYFFARTVLTKGCTILPGIGKSYWHIGMNLAHSNLSDNCASNDSEESNLAQNQNQLITGGDC